MKLLFFTMIVLQAAFLQSSFGLDASQIKEKCEEIADLDETAPVVIELINNPPALFTACTEDTDCQIIGGPCGWPAPAAKRFADCYAFVSRFEGATIDCSWHQAPERRVVCTNKKCTLK